jgi:putative ABC transport system substrate-binding protein
VIDRRTFLAGTGAVLLAAPLAAEAQQTGKVWRIGFLGNFSPTPGATFISTAFIDGLRQYSYVEGRNLVIEVRFAQGHEEQYPQLVRELLQANVELVVTTLTPAALALKESTKTLPVVMLGVADPVETGLVQSLARPGGNITGLSSQVGDLDGKVVQLARELVPKLSRLAVLWYPSNQASALSLKNVQALAAREGISVVPASAQAQNPGEVERIISALVRERLDVLYVHGPYSSQAAAIGELAVRHRLPTISVFTSMTRNGLLISYAFDSASLFRRGAYYVDRILKGAKPADLPVEQPTKFELVINLKTAKALGLTIPQSLLQRADEVIQ